MGPAPGGCPRSGKSQRSSLHMRGAQGEGRRWRRPCGTVGVLLVACPAVPSSGATRTTGGPGTHSVLGTRGLLVRGRRAPCSRHGRSGDAGQGVEAVRVDGRDERQRLHAQRVGRVLGEQGDGGLLGGEEAGGQVGRLHLRAPGRALAGLGVCYFVDDHQLVRKVRLRLFRTRGGICRTLGGGGCGR